MTLQAKNVRSGSIAHIISPQARDMLEQAFEDGRQGYMADGENPHEPGSIIYHVWNIGHTSAELDDDDAMACAAAIFNNLTEAAYLAKEPEARS